MLPRLRIDGPPIIEIDDTDWVIKCKRLLGIVSLPMALRGETLKQAWLHEQFLVDSLIDVQAQ